MVKLSELSDSEKLLLRWLGKEDSSALGECRGRELRVMVHLGLAHVGPTPPGREDDYARVSLTEDGIRLLQALTAT